MICTLPWYSLQLHFTGSYGPCCHIRFPNDAIPGTADELMSLFNSKPMTRLRRSLIEDTIEGSPCEKCYDRYFDIDHDIFGMSGSLPKYSRHGQSFEKVYALASKSYQNQETTLTTTPLELYLYTSEGCNLQCAMCSQNKRTDTMFPVEKAKQLVREIGWQHLDRFGWVGGESLLTEDGRALLDWVSTEPSGGTCIYITTNGTLIHAVSDNLKKIENLFLTISIDGTKENYEYVRKNAKWDTLRSGIDLLLKEKQHRPLWKLNIHSLVMKSTLGDLIDIMELAESMDATVFFYPIQDWHANENIFLFPKLIAQESISRKLDQAIAYATDAKLVKAMDSLVKIREYYEDIKAFGIAFVERVERIKKEMGSSPIVCFGAGSHFDVLIRNTEIASLAIVAVADNDSAKWGKTIHGFPIIPPEKIPTHSRNVVITSLEYEKEIKEFLRVRFKGRLNAHALYSDIS